MEFVLSDNYYADNDPDLTVYTYIIDVFQSGVGGGPVKKHSITDPQAVAEQWSRRFKVVKIPFAEPFKRGRWTCQDFFDPPEGQHASKTESDKSTILTGQQQPVRLCTLSTMRSTQLSVLAVWEMAIFGATFH